MHKASSQSVAQQHYTMLRNSMLAMLSTCWTPLLMNAFITKVRGCVAQENYAVHSELYNLISIDCCNVIKRPNCVTPRPRRTFH